MCINTSPQDLIRIFETLDVDGNETLAPKELEEGLLNVGVPQRNIDHLLHEMDLNENGKISFSEYKLVIGMTNEPLSEWKRLFVSIDHDRSGTIAVSEVHRMFQKADVPMSIMALEVFISEHDENGDGLLNLGEFISFIAQEAGFSI